MAFLVKAIRALIMMSSEIEKYFPNLKDSGYKITSPSTIEYNCIAWAAGDTDAWWWPDQMYTAYWPPNVPRVVSIASFIKAYETLGYKTCNTAEYEVGYEKVIIYTDYGGKPTHAARQLDSGLWTSKLGNAQDIQHALNGLSDTLYGSIAVIMKRLKV